MVNLSTFLQYLLRQGPYGVPLVSLPVEFQYPELLEAGVARKYIEFGNQNYCHIGTENQLVLEATWSFNCPHRINGHSVLHNAHHRNGDPPVYIRITSNPATLGKLTRAFGAQTLPDIPHRKDRQTEILLHLLAEDATTWTHSQKAYQIAHFCNVPVCSIHVDIRILKQAGLVASFTGNHGGTILTELGKQHAERILQTQGLTHAQNRNK